jgi:hypothetical protein
MLYSGVHRLAVTKRSHHEERRRVVERTPDPACRSTIEIEILIFDSDRQLWLLRGSYSNRRSCRAHSISQHLGRDVP